MLFHPILNQIANLDMAFLVKPADEQRIEGQTACFCPLCQKEEADDGEQGKAKQTPHLIIYNNERGGMYNGVGVDNNTKAEHGVGTLTSPKRSDSILKFLTSAII